MGHHDKVTTSAPTPFQHQLTHPRPHIAILFHKMSGQQASTETSGQPGLSAAMLQLIRGEGPQEEQKQQAYDKSLNRWWKEYTARKNDEEEEHVADSLLYDERCHLPRTLAGPVFSSGEEQAQPPQQETPQQQQKPQLTGPA